MMKYLIFISLIVVSLFFGTTSEARVFMKRDEGLKTAFPEADTIEKTKVFLTKDQVREIESLSKTNLDSKLYVIYEAKKNEQTLGYAIIDTHELRTQTETVMFVINRDGTLRNAEVLAFFEPPEYMAGDKWLRLFNNKGVETDSLKLGKDIPNMTGATITANSLTHSIRRVLAVFQVAMNQGLLYSETDN